MSPRPNPARGDAPGKDFNLASIVAARPSTYTLGLMHYVVTVAIGVLYFAGVLAGVPMVGPTISWVFIAAWSAAFVWCYLAFLRGRAFTAVSIVIVVTIVLPLVALVAIAWPNFDFLWPAFQDRGALGGLEFFAPLIAALICVLLARRLRPYVAHD